ncbi:MAG: outer membrane protein assembly factor BamB [Chitinophagaceae bacterium]|nr:outer membrane protein assembly factor BamB [Rubrivivax sp.]
MLCAAAVAVGACSSDKPPPTPLETYQPKIAGSRVWSTSVGGFSGIGFVMVPAVHDGRFYIAAGDGTVLALQADTGAEVWRATAGGPLAAGVGSDGRFTSVVTRGNEVVTFEAGRALWRKRLPSSVVTPPLVAGERVFVMGVDRAVHAFDALDGRRLWVLQRPGEALTLAQSGVIASFGNSLLVGQGPRLAALDPVRGTVQWEVPMASPRGTNEVERLADLIGPISRVGDRVCARAFQSAVACVDASKGSVLWTRNIGGINAVGSDAETVFGGDASDRLTAWRAGNGDVAWTSEKLLYRGLSGALAVGPTVVFGDAEGYLHFLSTATGETQLRLPTDGSAIVGTPVLSGVTLLVTTRKGGLFAFRPQ